MSPLVVWIAIAVAAAAATAVAFDMDARGQPGWLYGALVILVLPVGLAAWFVVRRRRPRRGAAEL